MQINGILKFTPNGTQTLQQRQCNSTFLSRNSCDTVSFTRVHEGRRISKEEPEDINLKLIEKSKPDSAKWIREHRLPNAVSSELIKYFKRDDLAYFSHDAAGNVAETILTAVNTPDSDDIALAKVLAEFFDPASPANMDYADKEKASSPTEVIVDKLLKASKTSKLYRNFTESVLKRIIPTDKSGKNTGIILKILEEQVTDSSDLFENRMFGELTEFVRKKAIYHKIPGYRQY